MAAQRSSRRWWTAGVLSLCGLVIGIDGLVLSLALPNLAVDLHASTSQLQWFADAYMLAVGATLLPGGMLGDRLGRKRVLLVALAVFGIGSVACAYAATAGELIAARAVLGVAAGVVAPLCLSVIPVLFDEGERQRALAIVAGSAFVAYPLGPVVGGWLLDHFWWGSVFLINVPIVALTLVAIVILMPESRSAVRPRLDPLGIGFSTAGLIVLTYGVIRVGEHGWGNRPAQVLLAAGVLALVGFGLWERLGARRGGRHPLVDVNLFRSRGFSVGMLLAMLMSFALLGLLFAIPQYYRAVLGLDAMDAGLWLLPMIGGLVVGLAVGDLISRRLGAKTAVVSGFVVCTAAMAVGALTGTGHGVGYAAGWLVIGGVGFGLALPPAVNVALGQLTAEQSGIGSALIKAVQQVGSTFGIAVLGSILNAGYRGELRLDGLPRQAGDVVRGSVAAGVAVARELGSPDLLAMVQRAFVHGMDVMLVWAGGIAAVSAIVALAVMPPGSRGNPPRSGTDPAASEQEPVPGSRLAPASRVEF